ncbi:hypothetical protein [Halolactibacillus halophilus]|nr:hypothetical protein [Halolactibacillus halophilus]
MINVGLKSQGKRGIILDDLDTHHDGMMNDTIIEWILSWLQIDKQ